MEFRGGSGERRYRYRMLKCECQFTRGLGWDVEAGGKPYGIAGKADDCSKRKEMVRLRLLELRNEYLKRFGAERNSAVLRDHIPEIVDDLKERIRHGEFLEDGNGASFWGGYFYLQTLAEIVDPTMNYWQVGDALVAAKKISLEGAVVRDYHEPPPAEWEECFRMEKHGWIGIASLPAHSEMLRAWKLDVVKPNGRPAFKKSVALQLSYGPTFGPDVSDVQCAKQKLLELIRKAKSRGKRKKGKK
ncbi:MAG: hypothetical protein KGI60_02225 [Patescibacteria group bacterium]|nr:hypothetical protein [Patescibacteria group bacterium]